jgi:hypothetical protein
MISRDDVAEYLDTQFSAMAASIGQDTDPLFGYEPDINLAFRRLGVARADLATATVEDGQDEAVCTLAEYYAARRIWRQLGDRVNNTRGQTSFNFDGQRKQAEDIMNDAKKLCTALGYDVSGDAWSVGYLNSDWLEPEVTW